MFDVQNMLVCILTVITMNDFPDRQRDTDDDTHGRKAPTLWRRVVDLYVDGFRSMTVGRSLWVLILLKVALLFLVFKLLFFPDVLSRDYDTDSERAQAVRSALIDGDRTGP